MWRRGIQPRGRDGTDMGIFIQNVARDRWMKHFPTSWRHNWVGYEDIQYAVPMAFIDYLLTPRSPYVKHNGYRVCLLEKEYNSLPYLLTEFKLQFPRVVTYLQAKHVGVRLLPPYYPDNAAVAVKTIEYTTLHTCCLLLRKYTIQNNYHSLSGFKEFVSTYNRSNHERVINRFHKCTEAAWTMYLARNIQHYE